MAYLKQEDENTYTLVGEKDADNDSVWIHVDNMALRISTTTSHVEVEAYDRNTDYDEEIGVTRFEFPVDKDGYCPVCKMVDETDIISLSVFPILEED